MIHRNGAEFKAAVCMLAVDLFFDFRVTDTATHILVDGMVSKAQIVLVRKTGKTVGRGLDEETLRQGKGTAKGDDLLGGVHAKR